MKKENQKSLFVASGMLMLFVLWTLLISFVDVKAIGPQESTVGFATINQFMHNLTGVNMTLYYITDWLSLIPLGIVVGFALLGVTQWIQRKHLREVDYNLFVLGGFYVAVMAVYVLFEIVVINFRPVLIEGCLEASYPSSTTVLVMCVMSTAIMQFNSHIKNKATKKFITLSLVSFIVFMVIGRLLSGVHWFTDIVGGALLSTGLVMIYHSVLLFNKN